MIQLVELTNYLNELLQSKLFKDYCPNGLQIEGKSALSRIGFAVSANLATIEMAIEEGVEALVCHHGLFWQGENMTLTGSKKEKIARLLEKQISLYGYHLPLDAHKEVGNNWRAALDLKWNHLLPFGEYNGSLIGVKGTFAERSIEEFVAQLETYYGHSAVIALGGKKRVSSAAIISGGAWRSLPEAASEGVDCFITGNFDEPAWGWAHEEGINFIALGHSATEKIGPRALSYHVRASLNVETLFLDVPNPF